MTATVYMLRVTEFLSGLKYTLVFPTKEVMEQYIQEAKKDTFWWNLHRDLDTMKVMGVNHNFTRPAGLVPLCPRICEILCSGKPLDPNAKSFNPPTPPTVIPKWTMKTLPPPGARAPNHPVFVRWFGELQGIGCKKLAQDRVIDRYLELQHEFQLGRL